MIWVYFGIFLWGVFLIVAAVLGGRKVWDSLYKHDILTGWMIPVIFTGIVLIVIGLVYTVFETAVIYG